MTTEKKLSWYRWHWWGSWIALGAGVIACGLLALLKFTGRSSLRREDRRENMTFLRSMFSEEDGKSSFSRVATALLLLLALGWVTHLVMRNHALPDFGGLTIFISALYGLNKVGNAVELVRNQRRYVRQRRRRRQQRHESHGRASSRCGGSPILPGGNAMEARRLLVIRFTSGISAGSSIGVPGAAAGAKARAPTSSSIATARSFNAAPLTGQPAH